MVTDLLSPLLILPYLSTSPPRNLFLNLRTFSPLSLARTVLFSSLGIIVRWSIGVRLLSSAEAVTEDGGVLLLLARANLERERERERERQCERDDAASFGDYYYYYY